MIEFKEITWNNFNECISLELYEEQRNFLASNLYSLAQSYIALLNDKLPAMTFAIYDKNSMIGFIMMYYDTVDENEYGNEAAYGILRFMIDKKHQGKGFGKESLEKALEYIRTYPQGKAKAVYIAYNPENEVANKLYKTFGFKGTGKVNDEDEVIVRLEL